MTKFDSSTPIRDSRLVTSFSAFNLTTRLGSTLYVRFSNSLPEFVIPICSSIIGSFLFELLTKLYNLWIFNVSVWLRLLPEAYSANSDFALSNSRFASDETGFVLAIGPDIERSSYMSVVVSLADPKLSFCLYFSLSKIFSLPTQFFRNDKTFALSTVIGVLAYNFKLKLINVVSVAPCPGLPVWACLFCKTSTWRA